MRAFLFWLAMRLPCRVISDANEPYLERYYLAQFLGRRYYLHRFVASDPDRGFHDHPWKSAWSLILSGHYVEATRHGFRDVRWFNTLTFSTFHRVLIGDVVPDCPTEVWSLFSHTYPDVKGWGFLRKTPGNLWKYYPFNYSGKRKNHRWELDAPKGRDIPRNVKGIALPEADMYAGN